MLDKGGREHAVHRGLTGVHALEITARHDPQPRGLGGTGGHRVLDLVAVEAHGARGSSGRPDMTGRSGHVPAGVVVGLACGVCDPRLHLEAECETGQGVTTADRPVVGNGQDRRPHRAAAVHGRPRRVVHVVEVEHMRGERVEEGRERRRDSHPRADNRCAPTVFASGDGFAGPPGGVVGRAGDRHPDVVDERAPRRMHDGFGYLPGFLLGDERREGRRRTAARH